MNYTLQQLRYLVAVAEHGNVSAAARSLYVSQPGVSAAISHLEETFGIQCFVRHQAKGVTLTSAGKSFVAAAQEVLTMAEGLQHRAQELNQAVRTHIALGCCYELAYFFLPQVLEIFEIADPGISLRIRVGDAESLQRWLRDGDIEAALMYDLNCDPVIFLKHYLTSFLPHALLPANHPLASQASVRPRDLLNEPLILLDCAQSSDYILSIFQPNRKRPNVRHRVSSVELLLRLVSSGKGYAILNARPVLDTSNHSLPVRWLPIEDQTRSLSVALVSVRSVKLYGRGAALTNVLNAVKERIGVGHSQLAS